MSKYVIIKWRIKNGRKAGDIVERIADFLQMLEQKGCLTASQKQVLWQYQQVSERSLYHHLVDAGVLTLEQWEHWTAEFYGLPVVELRGRTIAPEVVSSLPQSLQKRYDILPFEAADGKIWIAAAKVPPKELLEDLALFDKRQAVIVLAAAEEIEEVRLATLAAAEAQQEERRPFFEVTAKEEEENWAAHVLYQGIERALNWQASDLHIEAWRDSVTIKLRIDGLLRPLWQLPKGMHSTLLNRVKIMAGMDIAERRLPQDGHMTLKWQGQLINVRVSTLPFIYGEKAVLRFLGLEQSLLDIKQLGLTADNLAKVRQALERPYGLLLATGPTGSGKSTTLYSLLSALQGRGRNIVTIEDPVEFELEGSNQLQVNEKIGLTFSQGLRGILRQDPDIIMVGEIRDQETAAIAVKAANSGHLVLGSLHTNNAVSAVLRLLEMGIEPFLIANSLIAVIAQRLVRRNCPHCLRQDEAQSLAIAQMTGQAAEAWRGSGCTQCHDIGFKGRLALQEVWLLEAADRQAIQARRFEQRLAAGISFATMREDGLAKVRQGLTTWDEVAAATIAAEEQ